MYIIDGENYWNSECDEKIINESGDIVHYLLKMSQSHQNGIFSRCHQDIKRDLKLVIYIYIYIYISFGIISAVGWNVECLRDTETGHILLGTSQGSIIETLISAGGVVSFVKEHTSSFGGEKDLTISDIKIFLVNDDDIKNTRFIVFICQPGRLYSIPAFVDMSPPPKTNYMSSASLQAGWISMPEVPQHIFHVFFANKDVQQTCLFMPNSGRGLSGESALIVYPLTEPNRFLWLGPSGLTVGKINLAADKQRDILEEEHHMEHRRIEGRLESPVGVSLTEYHILLAYSTRMTAISLFTYNVVYEDIWSQEFGTAIGLTCDHSSEFHWLFTPSTTMKYRPNDEGRYVWRMFLDRGDYAKALAIAINRLNIDPEAHELVLKRQADKYIAEKNFTAAAEILAQSTEAFETVVLKFLSSEDDKKLGLKTLLDKKLEKMSKPEDRMKRDVLVMWLLEIQLAELAQMRREGRDAEASEQAKHLQRFIIRKNVHNSSELFYQYAPELVEHIPTELFACLIGNEKIRPQEMLPTIYLCQKHHEMAAEAIKYLEWAVTTLSGSHDVCLYNLLITMFAQFNSDKLHEFLVKQGRDKTNILYDLDFAIRTCRQHGLNKSTIFLYCVSEMFNEAVDMALKVNNLYILLKLNPIVYFIIIKLDVDDGVALAKECAHLMDPEEDDVIMGLQPKYSIEQRRRVWLKIASHVIEKDGDVVKCIGLLKESGDVITIQDILPLFPEFTNIEHFKDPLCACLKEHSLKIQKYDYKRLIIQELQQAMKDATHIAQEIREKTNRLKNRVTVIKVGDVCSGCGRSLSGRPFYAHACRHFFHRDCLENAMLAFIDQEAKMRLTNLISRERDLLKLFEIEERSSSTNKVFTAEREALFEQISNEINELLGAECPLCGTIAIELIDKPFFNDEEYSADQKSWMT
uniref:Vacuolar protein sorting-associated protein 18 homolog n=1 Tax=Heterorhabditis bacteriophora TaxID=37862 RepID=A0A1I7XT34_HETBA